MRKHVYNNVLTVDYFMLYYSSIYFIHPCDYPALSMRELSIDERSIHSFCQLRY